VRVTVIFTESIILRNIMSEQDKDKKIVEEPEEDNGKSNIRIGGNVSGGIVQLGGTSTNYGDVKVTFTQNNMLAAGEDVRQQLETQINQLMAELEKLKAENPDEVEEVDLAVQDAVNEAQQEKPDKKRLEIRGKNLMKAAKNLAAVAPIAVQIAKTLLLIG
jgi:hypothetical protein